MSELALPSPSFRPISRLFTLGFRLAAFVAGLLATAFMIDAHAQWGVVSAFICFALVLVRTQFARVAAEAIREPKEKD